MRARLWSLLRLFIIWKKDLSLDLPEALDERPDCLIMLAFGQAYERVSLGIGLERHRIIAGEPNEKIAEVMEGCDRSITYPNQFPPILAQWEFPETRAFRAPYGRRSLKAFATLGVRGEYKNTREILQEAKSIMDKNGWHSAVLVAHPWHLASCQWTAQKLGIRVIHDRLLTGELNDFASVWNKGVEVPPKQEQTTSLGAWLWYEFRARGYFWLKGWI